MRTGKTRKMAAGIVVAAGVLAGSTLGAVAEGRYTYVSGCCAKYAVRIYYRPCNRLCRKQIFCDGYGRNAFCSG